MKRLPAIAILLTLCLYASAASAHFGMVIPDRSVVHPDDRNLSLTLSFSHPFEGQGMELVRPDRFYMVQDGKTTDLQEALKPVKVMEHAAWRADLAVKRPGMMTFVMEPKPYPEPAEDNYIIHYTKTVVSAFDEGEDWNRPVGLKTEIVPLTRPWGNYSGNVFQGVVLVDGKPAPYTRVEVEYYNSDGSLAAPSDCMITQEVLCDADGVFTFACPLSGWWGFAALTDADYTIEGKDVELGAVLWIEMKDYARK